MTAYTRDHDKAGTTEYMAITGGEDADGYAMDCERNTLPTREEAQAWAEGRLKARAGGAFCADIYEMFWEENRVHDREYGTVYDADAVEKNSQYGWLKDDGSVEWDSICRY